MLVSHCYGYRAPQCYTLWGQVIEAGMGGWVTHTKQVSVFMGTNFTKSLVMQTCRSAHYIRDTRKPIKNASTRILQASHQSADKAGGRHPHWLWVSIANPDTKHSAKSNSSSHFYCLKRNIINSTTQQK